MANNCDFTIRAVGKTKESVEKLLDVLRYKNPEMCLYRVFSADKTTEGAKQDGDLWMLDLIGDVAWSCTMWLHTTDTGHPYAGSKLAVLPEICKALEIGVEIWAEEPGVGFEQHIIVNHEGEIVFDDSEDMSYVQDEETGDFKENPDGSWVKDGGFEDYMEFAFPVEIFG